MKKQSIYLAGPITGSSYEKTNNWREDLSEDFENNYNICCYSPMRGKTYLSKESKIKTAYEERDKPLSGSKVITIRDRDDVRNCGLIIFNFLGAESVSAGSCIEIGWGDSVRVPMIAIMEEDNPHQHGMIKELCLVVSNIEEAKFLALQILG